MTEQGNEPTPVGTLPTTDGRASAGNAEAARIQDTPSGSGAAVPESPTSTRASCTPPTSR
jgi:hypothetical protein